LLLYAAAMIGSQEGALAGRVLFPVAASGGIFLNLNYHRSQLPLPKGLIVLHAIAPWAGFVLPSAATWQLRAA
jgi:hypothetical protein